MENDYTNKHFTAVFFLICTVAVVFLILFSFIQKKNYSPNGSASTQMTISPTPLVAVEQKTGALFLKTKNDKISYVTGEPIHLFVYANSYATPIDGFDVVLRFDDSKLSLTSSKSLDPSFALYSVTKSNVVNITGAKKLSDQTATIFTDSPIAELVFQPKKSGSAAFSFDFKKGATKDSNLIDEKSTDVLNSTTGITVYVGEPIQLNLNRDLTVDENLSLQLISIEPHDDQCSDCIEGATIEAKSAGQTKLLEFKIGGIAGLNQTTQEAFGYFFDLDSMQNTSIKLNVSKK